MKIRLKGRRLNNNDPIMFKNPKGDPIFFKAIGEVSNDIPDDVAQKLCTQFPDILEIVTGSPEPKVTAAPANKMVKTVKAKKAGDEEPITPPEE
jgi:hypothetical protein